MGRLREWACRLWATLRRNHNDSELEEELRIHLQFASEDMERQGRPPEDASKNARLQLGGLLQAMEGMRDQRGFPWLEDLIRDARHGVRLLRRSPMFTTVTVLTLGLGIGATTAIFSLINAVLFRPLPFSNPDQLVMVWEDASFIGFPRNTPAPANYVDIKAQSRTLKDLAALDSGSFNLTGDAEPERVEARGVTANFFPLLGTIPIIGRSFTLEEDTPQGPKVVMLSYSLWQSRYGGDQSVVGRDLLLNGEKYTVVGVLPPGFEFLQDAGIFVPMAFTPELLNNRGSHYLTLVGRMMPGVTVAESNAEIQTIMRRIGQQYPEETTNGKLGGIVLPLRDQLAGDVRQPLFVLLIAVCSVLLIACANVANLLLARASTRRRELAISAALGAGRARMVAQSLTESMLLAVAGGGTGVLLAKWSFGLLRPIVPDGMELSTKLGLDWRILGFAALVTLSTGLICGVVPALQTCRVNLNDALKQSGSRALPGSNTRFRNGLVIGEVTLAMLLLVGAGLLIQTLFHLRWQYSPLRPQNVLAVRTQLLGARYRELSQRVAFYDDVLVRIKRLPGVVSAGFTTFVPLSWKGGAMSIIREGYQPQAGVIYDANFRVISEDYFPAIGSELLEGRLFTDKDDVRSMRVAIVNQTMATHFWPGTPALGKRFKIGDPNRPGPWITIVGIVGDVKQMGADAPARAEMYIPYRQQTGDPFYFPRDLVIRTFVSPANLVPSVRREIHAVDPAQPISDVQTLADVLGKEVATRELGTTLLSVFAGLALLLSMLGIYGVLSYFVAQHTAEIGLRMALGAQPANILKEVLKKGMILAGTGLGIGLVAALGLTRLLRSLLYKVSAVDPVTFAGVSALFLAVALLACYIPARRALEVDPMVALRCE